MNLSFTKSAWDDYQYWLQNDKRVLRSPWWIVAVDVPGDLANFVSSVSVGPA